MKKILLLISIAFLFTVSYRDVHAAATINKPTNLLGLVGYWTFDGKDMTPNVRDISGNANHGNLSGQTSTSTVIGKIGQALRFDGVDDRVISPDLSLNTNATYSVWIKPNTNFGTSGSGIFDTKPVAGGAVRVFGHVGSPAQVCWDIGGNSPNQCAGDTGYNISDWTNEWHHLVVVLSGGNTTMLYVDGVYAGSVSNSISASSNTFDIGYYNTNFFDGTIDEVRAYNRVLSATEIKSIYNSGSSKVSATRSGGTLASGLIGHWTFDGKDMGPNVRDVSGQGNHGNLTGIATTTGIGKIGQSFSFPGSYSSYVDYGTAIDSSISTALTLSAWVYRVPGSQEYSSIITDESYGDNLGYYFGDMTGGGANDSLYQCRINGGSGNSALAEESSITYNEWTYYTCIFDGDLLYFYKNGILVDTENPPATSVSTDYTGSAVIGEGLNGKIDDVRIYNRVLSASEIKQLYSMGESKINDSQNAKGGTLQSGLAALWSFDGKDMTPRVMDRSGNGYNATINGQTSTTTTIGKIGQALSFDGVNDYVSASPGISYSDSFTVSFWTKVKSNAGSYKAFVIGRGAGQDDYSTGFVIDMGPDPTGSLSYIGVEGNGMNTNTDLLTSSFDFDTWHHIVVDFSVGSNAVKLYADGVLEGTRTRSAGSVGLSDIQLGARYYSSFVSGYLDGSLDDVRIYNRSLSASEVKQLYNMGR